MLETFVYDTTSVQERLLFPWGTTTSAHYVPSSASDALAAISRYEELSTINSERSQRQQG